MAWNAHTDYMLAMFNGKAESVFLFGPEGALWGKSGVDQTFVPSQLCDTMKNPTNGLFCESGKFMFLRLIEDVYAFNRKGKGSLLFKGEKCVIIVVAAEGHKIETCTSSLQKAREYMEGIGYK